MSRTIKVAWVCHFSNAKIREFAAIKIPLTERILRRRSAFNSDFAQWNTNAINEIVKYPEFELHVICPVPFLRKKIQEIKDNNVTYHFFRDERMSIQYRFCHYIAKVKNPNYLTNRKRISKIIKIVKPDIVHVIGAENGYYAKVVLDIESSIPTIVQLQTLVNDPAFENGYFLDKDTYKITCNSEAEILAKASYIGTTITKYQNIIKERINQNAKFIPIKLAIGPKMSKENLPKYYDCVYFAANIEKSSDLAIEAFVRAKRAIPTLSMVVIGNYSNNFKQRLEDILRKNNSLDSVRFLGRLPFYSDVLSHVQHARCALLPLKVDYMSSTIRESMALSIPTLSTITDGTPTLNDKRPSILLSETGDHNKLANNLVKLLSDSSLYKEFQENGYKTIEEMYSNKTIIESWIHQYKQIIKNHYVQI